MNNMAVRVISKEHYELIHELFDGATGSIKIISPFVTQPLADVFAACKKQNPGIEAKLITRFYHEDFIKGVSNIDALETLYQSGIDIYVLQDLHTKLYLFDTDTALIGSANFTSGGFGSNHELSMCIKEEIEVNPILVSHFDELVEDIVSQSPDYLLNLEKIKEESTEVKADKKKRTGKTGQFISTKKFGAKLPTTDKDGKADEHDNIQTILSVAPDKEYNKTIWIKFEGSSERRRAMTDNYSPYITEQFPQGATFFSEAKRPMRVKAGDYVYMAVHCEADLPYIVGRGRSAGYDIGNIATPEMMKEKDWTARYNHYYCFLEFEYIDAPILECISLNDVLQNLNSNFYVSTKGEKLSMEKLRIRHRQQAHMRLTIQAKEYLDCLFDELVGKHGSCKLSPVDEKFIDKDNSTNKITLDMIKIAYEIAKKVHADPEFGFLKGKEEIAEKSGMKPGSAGDFINNFKAMMEGKEYQRTLNGEATRYFLENIRNDFGDEALKTALKACQKHIKYYASLGNGNLRNIERIMNEFAKSI